MRYGKKISAILAAAMVFSSVPCFAAVADTTVLDAENYVQIVDDADATVAAEVKVTVEQPANGTVEISNASMASEMTVDIAKAAAAGEVIEANDSFALIAPAELGASGTDKSGVFADNKSISTTYMEFRKSSSTNFKFVFEPLENGELTVYARSGPDKPIGLVDTSDTSNIQKKYLGTDTESPSGSSEKYLYDKATFEVEMGKKYELYTDGGTGRLFGIKFVGKNESASTEALTVNAGENVKVVATPNEGYQNGKILIDGAEVSSAATYTFTAEADVTVTAIFEKDPTLVAAENEFNNLTFASDVTEDLTLPTELAGGLVQIVWESSDASVIGVDGKVNRTVGQDIPVTLTATATIGGTETLTKTFNLTVKSVEYATELEKAVFEIPETITEDFKLPATFLGAKLVWTVDQTRYITFGNNVDADGNITATVTKPYFVEGDKAVVITATVEGTKASRSFNATVLKNENSAEASTAHFVAENIVLEGEKGSSATKIIIDSDIALPAKDETYGGTITWRSSNPKVVSATGNVKRQSKDTTVYLTAIVEIDGIKASREFTIVVEGTGSNGGSGGSGGGGGSYSSGGYVSTGGGVVGSYTEYTDIVADANIKTNVNAVKFTDLQDHSWAVPHITRLVNNKIVNGIGDNKFDPNGLVTREQFATMLVRAFGFANDTTNAKKFDDVVPGSYYAEAVAILNSMGVVNGQSETIFGVGQGITRQDMAVMCALATKLEGDKEVTAFVDAAEIADYAVESVTKMQKCGIFAGDENNNFNPTANATRAEAAKVISMILDCIEK